MNHKELGKEVAEHLNLKEVDGKFYTIFGNKTQEGLGQLVDALYKKVYTQKTYALLNKESRLNRHLTKEIRVIK